MYGHQQHRSLGVVTDDVSAEVFDIRTFHEVDAVSTTSGNPRVSDSNSRAVGDSDGCSYSGYHYIASCIEYFRMFKFIGIAVGVHEDPAPVARSVGFPAQGDL